MERLVRPMQKGLVRPMQKGPVRAMKQLVRPMQPLARPILICLFGKGAGPEDETAGSADETAELGQGSSWPGCLPSSTIDSRWRLGLSRGMHTVARN